MVATRDKATVAIASKRQGRPPKNAATTPEPNAPTPAKKTSERPNKKVATFTCGKEGISNENVAGNKIDEASKFGIQEEARTTQERCDQWKGKRQRQKE